MNYQDLVNLYLEEYENKKRQDYINKNKANFQTKGLNGAKDLMGRIQKYGNYINNAGQFLSKSNNGFINSAGEKLSSFGSNMSQKAGQVNDILNKPNNLINTAKDTALTKAGSFMQNAESPLIQKIGSGLSVLGGGSSLAGASPLSSIPASQSASVAGAVNSAVNGTAAAGSGSAISGAISSAAPSAAGTAGTIGGTSAATTGGAAAGGAAGGSAMGGAAAAGPWAVIAALAIMALQGTNRKRASAAGDSLIGDSLKTLKANSDALNKERQMEEEQLLKDMYAKYGWIQ